MGKKWLTTKQKADEEQLSPKQVIRRARKDLYPGAYQLSPGGEWRFPAAEAYTRPPKALTDKALTDEEIVTQEERKQAVLSHFENLRRVATQMKLELWLPVPWRWDIANLEYVFYVDREKVGRGEGITGYKPPSELEGAEESRGQFRYFGEGCVYWTLQDDGPIVLKLPVEDKPTFGHLREHSWESSTWVMFPKWKQLGGEYIQLCSWLLDRINEDAKKAIGAKSELCGWAIYHDTFCIKKTRYRCERCGTENAPQSKFCEECYLLLGWLHPILKRYESAAKGSQLSPIHIPGWGNIEESVPIDKFKDIVPALKELVNKYRGCDLVETILERENEVKEIGTQFKQVVESLSQQKVFPGCCEACPL